MFARFLLIEVWTLNLLNQILMFGNTGEVFKLSKNNFISWYKASLQKMGDPD